MTNDKMTKEKSYEVGLRKIRGNSGQVMFLTVVVLGVVISSVTMIAGLLMSYQLRRSADVSHSGRAIFAADAGAECMLYRMFNLGEDGANAENGCNAEGIKSNFENKASFKIKKSEESWEGGIPKKFISTGTYGTSVRTIEINLPQF